MMGIGVIDSIASADEMNKATSSSKTQNSAPSTAFPVKKVQTTATNLIDPNEPPFEAYSEAEEMARIMDGEVVETATMVANGKEVEVPTAKNSPFPKFRDCPHENTQHSTYPKCFNCYTQQQNNRT